MVPASELASASKRVKRPADWSDGRRPIDDEALRPRSGQRWDGIVRMPTTRRKYPRRAAVASRSMTRSVDAHAVRILVCLYFVEAAVLLILVAVSKAPVYDW